MSLTCGITKKIFREEDLSVAQKREKERQRCLCVCSSEPCNIFVSSTVRVKARLLIAFPISHPFIDPFSSYTQANKASINTMFKSHYLQCNPFCGNKEHGKFPRHNMTMHSMMMWLNSIGFLKDLCM